MGRKGITSADVVQAYVALLKQRRTPSLINLRLQLGWGSYASISHHLRRLALRQVAAQAQRATKRSRAEDRSSLSEEPSRLGSAESEFTRL